MCHDLYLGIVYVRKSSKRRNDRSVTVSGVRKNMQTAEGQETIFEYEVILDGEWTFSTIINKNSEHLGICHRFRHLKSGDGSDAFEELTAKFEGYEKIQDWKLRIVQGKDPFGWEYSTAKEGPYAGFQQIQSTVRRRKWHAIFRG